MTAGSLPSPPSGIPVRAEAEWLALVDALDECGVRPPCAGRGTDFFAHPDSEAAELAAASCWPCVARLECLAFAVANGERWGVWGGQNLHPARPSRVSPPPTMAGATQPDRPRDERSPT